LDGYNVSILAYGQTLSGKTHTMVAFFLLLFVCVHSHINSSQINYNKIKRVSNSMLSNIGNEMAALWVNYFYMFFFVLVNDDWPNQLLL